MTAALCLRFADKQRLRYSTCATVPQEQLGLGAGKRECTGGQEHAIAGAVSIPALQQCATISTEYARMVLAVDSNKQPTAWYKLSVFVAISYTNVP